MLERAEWDAGQLRGQIGLVQQDLARTRNDLTAALAQAHTQVADLDGRSYNSSLIALVPTMSTSASPFASVSGQRRRS